MKMVGKQSIPLILFSISYAALAEDIASNTIQTAPTQNGNQNKDPGLTNSIRDFAELNANLKQKYQAVDMATDISSMVRDMVGSLSSVQARGESMMKNILIQQKRLKALRAETRRSEDLLANMSSQIAALEERRGLLYNEVGQMADRKQAAEAEMSKFNQLLQGQKQEKEQEVIRLKDEMMDYANRITEASRILNDIELQSEKKKTELQQMQERTDVAEVQSADVANNGSPTKSGVTTVDTMLVPALLVSVVANVVMGGQMLNLFNLEELADVAALSFGELPDERLDSDPIIQLAELKRKKEKKFGKKNIANNFIDRRKLYNSPYNNNNNLNQREELYPLL